MADKQVVSNLETMGINGHGRPNNVQYIKNEKMTSKDYYYDTYAHFGIHEEMLKDEVRTLTYRNAMRLNTHLFKDKIVLDVGCGTGILSMFAAQAGASKVIAVECSNIVEYAEAIIKQNKLDNVITVVRGKIEEIQLPDGIEKVDIIISEWMGYCLFYECMLDTVLFARDKWLSDGGSLFPDKATLYLVGIDDREYKEEKVNWWENVYGYDMSVVAKEVMSEPQIEVVNHNQLVTNLCVLKKVDLYSAKRGDLNFSSTFKISALGDSHIQAFLTFFTVEFTKCHTRIGFSTSPTAQRTHWKQTVFYFDKDINMKKKEEVTGEFSMMLNQENKREVEFKIKHSFNGEMDKAEETNTYRMR